MKPVIEARNVDLTVRIAGRDVLALRDLSFKVMPGKVLGLIGESGAGKSMVGRLLSRLLPPNFLVSAGSMVFEGEDLAKLSADEHRELLGHRIAFIPQEPLTSLNPVLSIGAQFSEHLARLGMKGERARRAAAVTHFASVHLPDPEGLLDKFPHQLSGGMCQRVLIAMAFASDPSLILADEPTTALDVMSQALVMELLREMQQKHRTAVILITHDLRLAAHVCDDIMVLYAGESVEYGPAKTVYEDSRHPYTRSLQLSNPPLSGPRQQLATLPDHMPGLTAFAGLAGCRFAPRCPARDAACANHVQSMREVEPGHFVRATDACVNHRIVPGPVVELAAGDTAGLSPILSIAHLNKQYRGRSRLFGSSPPFTAVRDFSLDLYPGEFVGIVGQSGSGKSTVAKLLLGLEAPTSGSIAINGRDVTANDPNIRALRVETLQMVFQDPQSALNPRRMVASLVTQSMEAGSRTATWDQRLERTRELLRETGLAPDTATRFPSQLSGGQRQRVNIARALCSAPKVLVADEIVSGLDVSVQAQILNLLLRLKGELDIGLVFISHDLSVVRYLCSRVLVMHKGDVVESGPTEQVFANPQADYTKRLIAAVPPDDANAPWPPQQIDKDAAA